MNRKNKDIAGFQILNILAEVDGSFDPKEGQVIIDYIIQNFPFGGNLEEATEELSTTTAEDYPILLQKCSEDFYADSTEKERLKLALWIRGFPCIGAPLAKNENNTIGEKYKEKGQTRVCP